MQNVEFKCELRDIALARGILKRLGAHLVRTLRQRDTYYKVADGKLKRRESWGEDGHPEPTEYVFYHRVQRVGPKLSHFTLLSEEQALRRYGEREMPVLVELEKRREVWIWKSVHAHLDDVDDVGKFFEADVLVTPRQHIGICHRMIASLRESLAPALGEPVSPGYAELALLEREISGDAA
ncbi:MAG: CYTH domain-containing protein [Planctomycetota bacterium]